MFAQDDDRSTSSHGPSRLRVLEWLREDTVSVGMVKLDRRQAATATTHRASSLGEVDPALA